MTFNKCHLLHISVSCYRVNTCRTFVTGSCHSFVYMLKKIISLVHCNITKQNHENQMNTVPSSSSQSWWVHPLLYRGRQSLSWSDLTGMSRDTAPSHSPYYATEKKKSKKTINILKNKFHDFLLLSHNVSLIFPQFSLIIFLDSLYLYPGGLTKSQGH